MTSMTSMTVMRWTVFRGRFEPGISVGGAAMRSRSERSVIMGRMAFLPLGILYLPRTTLELP